LYHFDQHQKAFFLGQPTVASDWMDENVSSDPPLATTTTRWGQHRIARYKGGRPMVEWIKGRWIVMQSSVCVDWCRSRTESNDNDLLRW